MSQTPRRRTAVLVLLLSSSSLFARSETWFPEPLSPRNANYTISVSLDPERKMLEGEEVLVWKNPSGDAIQELQFHLYLNAFRNASSTMMREPGGPRRRPQGPDYETGWIDVTSIRTTDGDDLVTSAEFIQPDDGNPHDRTILRLPLRRPVPPHQSITLRIGFTAKLPRVIRRSGFSREFFMVAQWFPKIAVYEPAGTRYASRGAWNCHQYHATGEFYSDFGVYDVHITVPSRFLVGATGTLVNTQPHGDTARTFAYHAEDVHDFAWSASPHFVELQDRWEHVQIRALMQPQHLAQGYRYISAAKKTFAFFHNHVGRYPYPALTIVDPAHDAPGAGGMEYPTLITAGTHVIEGEWIRLPENVVVHELGHAYWYGIVANNEAEEAWLDEGINQYFETRIMDEAYGLNTSMVNLAGLRIGDFEFTRARYLSMRNPKAAPIATIPWQFPPGTYGALTYDKTATTLSTLERLVARPTMDSIMSTYFRKWAFRHPSGRDFIATCSETVTLLHGTRYGPDLNWFFEQTIYGTDICDYQLSSITVDRLAQSNSDTSGEELCESRVTVSRLGELRLPVHLLVHFDNGTEVLEEWDGMARVTTFTYRRPERVVWATVDPEFILALDANIINNSCTLDPAPAPIWMYTTRLLFWLQNLLQTIAIFG